MTQTYLPSSDFSLVAKWLDNKRLNKQITEAKQVLTANKYGYGRQGNPTPYKMWKGHDRLLISYGITLYVEWRFRLRDGRRGGKELHKAGEFFLEESFKSSPTDISIPKWLGDERLHSNHRSVLLAKDFGWYSRWNWQEVPAISVKTSYQYFIPELDA